MVVGASAGGVDALIKFFAGLPADLAASIFVVLHIPSESPSHLAPILERACRLPVKEAEDLESIDPGQIYVASADRHLMIDGHRIRVTRGPRESRVRPSIDVLFRSASVSFGARVIAVVMSGTLDDGTAGAWAVKDRGGLVLVQEPSDAIHASMPESVIQHVKVDHVGTAQELGNMIAGLAGAPAPPVPSKPSHGHSV